jgi:hypothetical protein
MGGLVCNSIVVVETRQALSLRLIRLIKRPMIHFVTDCFYRYVSSYPFLFNAEICFFQKINQVDVREKVIQYTNVTLAPKPVSLSILGRYASHFLTTFLNALACIRFFCSQH